MSLNGCFDSLRLNADVSLRNGGGAVLQESLDKGNVIAVGLVDFRSIPLAETVSADALKTQIVADNGELLLNRPFGNGEDQILLADAVSQTVVLDILRDDQRMMYCPAVSSSTCWICQDYYQNNFALTSLDTKMYLQREN